MSNGNNEELDIEFEYEKLRRGKSYESLMSEVSVKGFSEQCGDWNDAKISEWARKFREITGGSETN